MILHGMPIAFDVENEVQRRIHALSRPPHLSVVLVGDHPPSATYVAVKRKACGRVGIASETIKLPEAVSEATLLSTLHALNHNPNVDGILIQFPLPGHLDHGPIVEALDPSKDVDGFHPLNQGKLLAGRSDGFIPCTPLGIAALLERYQIPVQGRHVVIVGRSMVVGRPLSILLSQNRPHANATITLAHRFTDRLPELIHSADIVVAAIGQPRFITADMIQKGAVVIDVGITRVNDSSGPGSIRLVGDVDFDNVRRIASAITPVPGGVGPMTVAMLLHNTVLAAERRAT